MLSQNAKGLLTLFLIIALLISIYAGYKSIIEPRFINNETGIFVSETENTLVSPEIEIYTDHAKISWNTPYESLGSIIYTRDRQECIDNSSNCLAVDSPQGQEHEVTIASLTPATEYFYKIKIDDTLYPIGESEFFSFITQAEEPSEENAQLENAPSLGGEFTVEDFRQAILDQNLEYDINNDGKVNIADIAQYKKDNEQ